MRNFLYKISGILLSLFCIISIFFVSPNVVRSAMNNDIVIEHLRLKVPSQQRIAWIKAERESWEPWLAKKSGFLGRQLLWDEKSQEAIVLISWASRKDWKSISSIEISKVQKDFEEIARVSTGQKSGNPFPLIYEGELSPQ